MGRESSHGKKKKLLTYQPQQIGLSEQAMDYLPPRLAVEGETAKIILMRTITLQTFKTFKGAPARMLYV